MTTSFENKKQLRFVVTLAEGVFSDKNNQVVLDGFRAVVEVQKAGGQMMSTSTVRIYGLAQELMNQLTTLAFKAMSYIKNTIDVIVLDGEQQTLIFRGQIINAWGDYSGMPDVCLYIETQTGYFQQLELGDPLVYKGSANVSDLMLTLAKRLGVPLENNGVTAKITNPNYGGSTIDQIRNLAANTETEFYLDDTVLAICPKGLTRKRTARVPLITSESGLIGYPTFDKVGITFNTLFNPSILFGSQIIMESDIPQANGLWQVCSMVHKLESEKPGGAWFTTVRCTGNGLVPL